MDFNTMLLRLGISPSNFTNKDAVALPFEGGMIYEVEQEAPSRICQFCGHGHCVKYGHYFTETNCSETENFKDVLRIKHIRLKCKNCGKTFSPEIRGIDRYATISKQVEQFIINDFTKPLTFSQIADRYGLTKQRTIQLFDEKIKYVPRRKMPRILCVDEIHFSEDVDQHYICVLYDFERKEIVDIIKNRQMPYLREYFASIPLKERENTEVFISDMYDGYSTVCTSYFPKATHIVDRFHIVTQLTRAVNSLRVMTMNSVKFHDDDAPFYNFMKTNWKLFLCRSEAIPDRTYTCRKTGEIFHFDEMVFSSIKLNDKLWAGYNALQDLLHFNLHSTFEEAVEFIEFLSAKLKNSGSDILKKAGDTFHKWRYGIANAYSNDAKRNHYSNAIAECINNQLKTILKTAYGYRNFERFRKRAMLLITYSKTD